MGLLRHSDSYMDDPQLTQILQEFTVDFMLKTLNIDLKIIGYDSGMGKWIRD